MKYPYDINEETEAGSHRVTKPIKLDPALPRCRQEGHGQGDRGPERSGDRLWVTQQSAERLLEASSRHLGTSPGSKENKTNLTKCFAKRLQVLPDGLRPTP